MKIKGERIDLDNQKPTHISELKDKTVCVVCMGAQGDLAAMVITGALEMHPAGEQFRVVGSEASLSETYVYFLSDDIKAIMMLADENGLKVLTPGGAIAIILIAFEPPADDEEAKQFLARFTGIDLQPPRKGN